MATHRFQPAHYHTIMGPHDPVLHVAPGDTVITSTVDAGGQDAREEHVTPGGNPQTGPFYVDGAEPGDTLVVRLDRIEPNRDRGFTGSSLDAGVVDTWYARELPESLRATWSIDREQRTTTVLHPTTHLGSLALPLAPMLGCFGVAPMDHQYISTATSAEHGGNMDYRGFVAGVTVYFPVFEVGALFHLGDCHARQGDGEIVGTGVEVSADVQFTVDLQKGRRIAWPRGETDEFIFCVGNGRPLDQALQHATTEMVRWLQTDYRLDSRDAGLLMGQCVEYDVGNVFDPAFTMVCKMPKRYLSALP